MPESTFPDLPILGELGAALDAAMAHEVLDEAAPTTRRRVRSNPFRTFAIAMLFAGLGTSTAAATLTVLRGSPIPVPRSIDQGPAMTAKLGTGTGLSLRSADPGGGPPFALRRSVSETGLTCVTVGQVRGQRFGVTGTDGTFRDMPAAVIDGCGQPSPGAPAVMGARIFDAPDRDDLRTVVYGVGGGDLARVAVQVRGRTQAVPVSDGGFVLGLREYPEDMGLDVQLTFGSGKTVHHRLGAGLMMYTDPSGPAWRVQVTGIEGYAANCLLVGAARPSRTTPQAPPVCGASGGKRQPVREDSFFTTRTIRPGDRGRTGWNGRWNWHGAPARTLVYGYADLKKIKTVTVLGAGKPIVVRRVSAGYFLVPLLPQPSTKAISIELTAMDGSKRIVDGDEHTIVPHKEGKR